MDDLIAFVRARLNEDEQAARAAEREAGSAAWNLGSPHSDVVYSESGGPIIAGPYADGFLHDSLREHIARHDPAHVLREVEAKRRIIELHELAVSKDPARFSVLTGEPLPDAYEVTCTVCGWADDDPTSGCETLRLLALPYADHPAYLEKWRP